MITEHRGMLQLKHLITLPQEHTTIIHNENLLDAIQDFSFTALRASAHHPDMISPPGFHHDVMTSNTTDAEENGNEELSPINMDQIQLSPHKKTVQTSTTSKQAISRKPCPPSSKQQQATQSSLHHKQFCNTASSHLTSALHFADTSVCPSTVSHTDAAARNTGWTSSSTMPWTALTATPSLVHKEPPDLSSRHPGVHPLDLAVFALEG
eukprot:5851057-Ditylum_brightwellii.AAC.1